MRTRQILTFAFIAVFLILSSSVSAEELINYTDSAISEPNTVCLTIPTWFEFFGIDSSINPVSGFIIAFFIVLIFGKLFYYVLGYADIFSKTITIIISVLLAMLLLPMGVVTAINNFMLKFVTGSTAFLLYLFLFVVCLGYGYRKKFEKPETNKTVVNNKINKNVTSKKKKDK